MQEVTTPIVEKGPTAAERRDEAASTRDAAADVRDAQAADTAEADQEDADRNFAAEDRAAAALDREDAARRSVAALARDIAAQARDVLAAGSDDSRHAREDRNIAAQDRAAAALDREGAAADRRGAAELMKNAYRDHLTGALLRSAGTDLLLRAADRARRDDDSFAVMFVDVDNLKSVNDQHGHAAGDLVLAAVGAALQQGLRSYDIVVRYGGDEFVCALPGLALVDAERRAEQLHAIMRASETGASISIGFAELRQNEALDAVVGRADRDMYNRRRAHRRAASGYQP